MTENYRTPDVYLSSGLPVSPESSQLKYCSIVDCTVDSAHFARGPLELCLRNHHLRYSFTMDSDSARRFMQEYNLYILDNIVDRPAKAYVNNWNVIGLQLLSSRR